MKKVCIFLSLLICMALVSTPAIGGGIKKSIGQTVFAPANHNCLWFSPEYGGYCTLSLDSRLVIRNIDLDHFITITEVKFYGPDGALVVELLHEQLELQPLASETFAFPPDNPDSYWSISTDGRPSFIVRWTAERSVHPLQVVSTHAMVNRTPNQSPNPISFEGIANSMGTVLSEDKRHKKK
jgi:hypothetical protein